MSKKSKYEQVYDGQWFPLEEKWQLACCDCGLVHDVYVRSISGKMQIRFDRNNRATANHRRSTANDN